MAQYISVEEFSEFVDNRYCDRCKECANCKDCWVDKAISLVESMADHECVPKSEYDQLQKKYYLAVAEREANVRGFTECLMALRKDVAKEIFAEIGEIATLRYKTVTMNFDEYEELKKKHKGE